MHESRRATRRATGEVVLLDEGNAQSAQGGVAGDAAAGDPAADDQHIELVARESGELSTALLDWRVVARGGGNSQIVLPKSAAHSRASGKLIKVGGVMTSSRFETGGPRSDDEMPIPDWARALAKVGMYVLGPIVLYRRAPIPTDRTLDPFTAEDERALPQALRDYVVAAEKELAAVGFGAPLRVASRRDVTLDVCFSLLEHPIDGALGTVSVIRAKPRNRLTAAVSFLSSFANGAILATSNSQSIPRTPPLPAMQAVRFPSISDAAELYDVHRFRVAEFRRGAVHVPMTRGSDPIAYQLRESSRVFEHWVRCGYFRRAGENMIRKTHGGAILSAWRGMFPWRQITEYHMSRKAAAVLEQRRRARGEGRTPRDDR